MKYRITSNFYGYLIFNYSEITDMRQRFPAWSSMPQHYRSLTIHHWVYSWKCQKCSGDCTSFFELEKRRPISPLPWTNSKIVYWSRVTLCNLYYFITRFSDFTHVRPGVCVRGIGRERLNRISWNLVAPQHICCFYYAPAFRRKGHCILQSVHRKEVVSVQ